MAKKAKDETGGAEKFDAQLEKLRSIVEKLEHGDLSLHENLKLFEEGVGLARGLFETLNLSEGKVEELLATMEKLPFSQVEE